MQFKNQKSAKLCLAVLWFLFWKNYDVLKWKIPCFWYNKNINFIKLRLNRKWKIPHTILKGWTMCFSSYKGKAVISWSEIKKREFFVTFFVPRKFFLNFCCIEYTFRIYILLHIKKDYFIHFCCLLIKSLKVFRISLNLRLFGNSWDKCLSKVFNTKYQVCCTCSKSNLSQNVAKFQNTILRIVDFIEQQYFQNFKTSLKRVILPQSKEIAEDFQ